MRKLGSKRGLENKMSDFIGYLIKKILKLFLTIYYVFPIEKEKITLLNELSYTYGDNMKYFDIYIHRKTSGKYKIVFPIKKGSKAPKYRDDIVVRPSTIRYFKEVLTSEIIITNAGGVSYLPKRKGQRIISTWHGGGPYKKTSVDVCDNYWFKLQNRMNSNNTDYILSSCKYFSDYEAKSMGYGELKIIPAGMPRNDIFFYNYQKIINKVRRYYSIPENTKFVLFAPTYRSKRNEFSNAESFDNYVELNIDRVIESLRKKYKCDWVCGIRLHPKLLNTELSGKKVINCTTYPDMQELLCAADIVISDYSSLIWDYSFTYRPIFIYAPDIDKYEKEPGFYMPSNKWPYPIAHNNEEMVRNILDFDNDIYITKLKEHHIASGNYETGHACKKLLELIETK